MTRKLWERQPWDTQTSFDRFVRFYLPQEPPRSQTEAYRRYMTERGRKWGGASVPGTWRAWAGGRDTNTGRIKAGAYTWEERAAALDEHLAAVDLARWEKRRRDFREQSHETLAEGMTRLMEMLRWPMHAQREEATEYDDQGRPIAVTYVIEPARWDFKAAAQLARSLQFMAEGLGFQDRPADDTPSLLAPGNTINIDVSNLTTDQLISIVTAAGSQLDSGGKERAGDT